MPSQLNRRALFAALAAFVLALGVAYALSSTGEASEVSGVSGAPAEPLDVASGVAGQTTLGEAEALPTLVRKPKPPAKHKAASVNAAAPAASPAPSAQPAPSSPAPTPPPVSTPPSNPEPPVQFEDSG
jgi:hypothetical protein